eukprot:12401572-Karenia_brevis.AAC.1
MAVDKLGQSDAFKFKMPYMPPADKGRAVKFKLCKSYYNYHYNKATGPGQGFLRLVARTGVALVPMGQ